MKRLVFCFDGTWNKLNENTPTNVVLTAASILRTDSHGRAQLIHYDEGVGTGKIDRQVGGMFGSGLVTNVREAYRFLIFNYDPGDEIYVFGFSRGAFSARTFIGLVRHVGPLRRLHAGRIDEAMDLYRQRLADRSGSSDAMSRFRADYASGVCIGAEDDAWRCAQVPGYASGQAPVLKVRFLGVWDTVGALGFPQIVPGNAWLNRKHRFHNVELDDFVEFARHAMALDERRSLFPPVSLGDLTRLNSSREFAPENEKAPYQERWFPGVHGSIGGGGDIRGLSDDALAWVLKVAKKAGLQLDTGAGTRIHGFHPDPLAPIVNVRHPKRDITHAIAADREGPKHLWQLSTSAVRRWLTPPERLGGTAYRPRSLARVEQELSLQPRWTFDPPTDLLATETVQIDDTLSKYALRHYGDAKLWPLIYEANRDTVLDPDDIFTGQTIRIPRR